jgi:hypothetical protein
LLWLRDLEILWLVFIEAINMIGGKASK